MVVPLPSKQIAPGQYRYTPPSPLYGLGPITRLPSCGVTEQKRGERGTFSVSIY